MKVESRTATELAALQRFSANLVAAMARAGLSQSDLARMIWGSEIDSRGREVARNRDRISSYARGLQLPEANNLVKLAAALGMPPGDLGLSAAQAVARGAQQGVSMRLIGGESNMMLLQVNQAVPAEVALQIVALLSGHEISQRASDK